MIDVVSHELGAGPDSETLSEVCDCGVVSGLSQPPTALHTVPDGQQPYIQQIVPGNNINIHVSKYMLKYYLGNVPAPHRLCWPLGVSQHVSPYASEPQRS